MNNPIYYPPQFAHENFNCAHCGVYAMQYWASISAKENIMGVYDRNRIIDGLAGFSENLPDNWVISKCNHCKSITIWHDEKIIYPKNLIVETPNKDLEDDIKMDYLEAASIFSDSPRASAALLRLCLQKLCIQLGEKGKDINHDIGNLVKRGLNTQIQKSLDILRITGNNAVHPGSINLKEEPELVIKLFRLINFIAEKMISEPKEIDDFYTELPEDAKDQINKRDQS